MMKSGSLNRKDIVASADGMQLICPTQTFQVHGYRLSVVSDTPIATVNVSGMFSLVLKVMAYQGKDASYEFDQQGYTYSPLDDAIEEKDGTAEMVICRFEVSQGLIVSVEQVCRQLNSSDVKLAGTMTSQW